MEVTKDQHMHTSAPKNDMRTIAIIGYGRFGVLWSTLLASVEGVSVFVYDKKLSPTDMPIAHNISYGTKDVLYNADILFFCVPISQLYHTLTEYIPLISSQSIVCDTCSVKVLPVKWMKELFPASQSILGTHPLFGPDSLSNREEGTSYLNIVTTKVRIHDSDYENICALFQKVGMQVHELSAESHDRQAVYSQGLTHLLGRVLSKLQLSKSIVSTRGFEALLDIVEQTCNDSRVLFMDIQKYNEGSQEMWNTLTDALKTTIQEIEAE